MAIERLRQPPTAELSSDTSDAARNWRRRLSRQLRAAVTASPVRLATSTAARAANPAGPGAAAREQRRLEEIPPPVRPLALTIR
jgi:hypothetical protein